MLLNLIRMKSLLQFCQERGEAALYSRGYVCGLFLAICGLIVQDACRNLFMFRVVKATTCSHGFLYRCGNPIAAPVKCPHKPWFSLSDDTEIGFGCPDIEECDGVFCLAPLHKGMVEGQGFKLYNLWVYMDTFQGIDIVLQGRFPDQRDTDRGAVIRRGPLPLGRA